MSNIVQLELDLDELPILHIPLGSRRVVLLALPPGGLLIEVEREETSAPLVPPADRAAEAPE